MDIYDVSVNEEKHKTLEHKIKLITVRKKKRTKISGEEIFDLAETLLKKQPGKKLMIKCLTEKGYFQLKGYNDDISVILNDDEYFNGREKSEGQKIYKATFYLL